MMRADLTYAVHMMLCSGTVSWPNLIPRPAALFNRPPPYVALSQVPAGTFTPCPSGHLYPGLMQMFNETFLQLQVEVFRTGAPAKYAQPEFPGNPAAFIVSGVAPRLQFPKALTLVAFELQPAIWLLLFVAPSEIHEFAELYRQAIEFADRYYPGSIYFK